MVLCNSFGEFQLAQDFSTELAFWALRADFHGHIDTVQYATRKS